MIPVLVLVVGIDPLFVVGIKPAFVVGMEPALVVGIIPDLAKVVAETTRTKIIVQMVDANFFIGFAPSNSKYQRRGRLGGFAY